MKTVTVTVTLTFALLSILFSELVMASGTGYVEKYNPENGKLALIIINEQPYNVIAVGNPDFRKDVSDLSTAANNRKVNVISVDTSRKLSMFYGNNFKEGALGMTPNNSSEIFFINGEETTSVTCDSAFADGSLNEQLKAGGIEKLIIVGISTPTGLSKTIRDALSLGYETILDEQLVADLTQTYPSIFSWVRPYSSDEFNKLIEGFREYRSTSQLRIICTPSRNISRSKRFNPDDDPCYKGANTAFKSF